MQKIKEHYKMYEASNISLKAGAKAILQDVNVFIEPGWFTAVVGPNGAGKSTLLKALSYEHNHYQGEVNINGKSVRLHTSKELSLVRAVLSQSVHLQFAFSVGQIVMLGRHPHNSTKKFNQEIIDEVINLTGIEPFRDRSYLTLSGGEKQRVQLARVLAQVWEETEYPRYVLLDEPTTSLDITQQQYIFSLVKQVCARNIGVLAIVHDLNQAVQFADRMYFLKAGKVVASGNAPDVFTKPVIEETFGCTVKVYRDPESDCPYIMPEVSDYKVRGTNYEVRRGISKNIEFKTNKSSI
jgi:iron complex transport system ATP-binding protein